MKNAEYRDKQVAQVIDLLQRFLPTIGVVSDHSLEEHDDTLATVTLYYGALFIDVGHPILRMRPMFLKGQQRIDKGYRVGYWKTISNYPHSPDDVEDVTVLETTNIYDAIEEIGKQIIHDIVEGLSDQDAVDPEDSSQN